MTPDGDDLNRLWDAVNSLKTKTLPIEVGRDMSRDLVEQREMIETLRRDATTTRERVEAIAAEVQRMKDKQFPKTRFSELTNDQLMYKLEYCFLNPETYERVLPDLRAEVRRRLNQ